VDVELREITDQNRDAVLSLGVAAGQERFVASVRDSLLDASEYPQANPWYRAVYAAGEPVGFVMLSWNVTPQPPEIIGPWFLWRLLVDERHQGRGYGAEVVRQVADLVRANGGTELLTSYVPDDGGPAGFYERLGFVPTGELDPDGEVIVRLPLPPADGYSTAELPLYFEWHGTPDDSHPPLLLVHGGGSTIESNWGRLIPAMAASRRMLAVELQGHGRTGPGTGSASFEGSADGVAALLEELAVGPVDVLGFSNGGQVAMQLAIRHPAAVRRLVVASAPFRRDGMVDGFWDGLAAGTFADLPQPYREADLAVSGDPAHAERMFHLDRELMLTGFTDWPDAMVASITASTLVVTADRDVIRPEHAVRLAGLIPDARLLIVPGNHGDYLGELAAAGDPGPLHRTLPFIVDFLDRPDSPTSG